jgi:hypothetical protein
MQVVISPEDTTGHLIKDELEINDSIIKGSLVRGMAILLGKRITIYSYSLVWL